MASCKDCVHVEACFRQKKIIIDRINRAAQFAEKFTNEKIKVGCCKHENFCELFCDRSRFMELPCKVGDTVYFNNVHLRYAKVIAIYIDASGGMFDLDITTNIETVAGYKHFINKDYTFEDIGKRIFLTKEAAEQVLKEREA